MAMIELEDNSGKIEVVVFPDTYEKHREFIVRKEDDQKVIFKGRPEIVDEEENGEVKFIAIDIEEQSIRDTN